MSASAAVNDGMDRAHNSGRRAAKSLAHEAENVRRTTSSELSNLIADVEDLLGKVANVADVDIAKLSQRLQEKLGTAKETLAAGSKRISDTARQAADATDGYVRQSPWQAMGIAALAGALVGFLLARK
jgi:ElaB/YqjD/DUF883 family membrane-anchored ribosome-binding protein